MSDIFDRVATTSIDHLVDLLGIPSKSRTVAYQYLAVALRGAWARWSNGNPALREMADHLIEIRIRHKDALPEKYRSLKDVAVIEDDSVSPTEVVLVYYKRWIKGEPL